MHSIIKKYLLTSICFSGFDPAAFMTSTIDQPLETEFKICPAGEYRAMIDDFTQEAIEQIDFEYKQGARAGSPGTMTKFNCPFIIDSDAARTELGRDKVLVDMQMILDVNPQTGGLDFGPNKNVKLGQIRKAVGQNNAGPWAIHQLRNAGPCMVKVEHISFQRKDGTSGKRAEITRVTQLAS